MFSHLLQLEHAIYFCDALPTGIHTAYISSLPYRRSQFGGKQKEKKTVKENDA